MEPFKFLWRHRHVLWHTTVSDIRARYTGSALGMAWAVLNPLLLLGVYVFIYNVVFKLKFEGLTTLEYVLVMFAGMNPYLGLSEGITTSITSVVGNATLLRSTFFPAPAIPVKAVLASMFSQVMGLIILLFALILTGRVNFLWFFLPVAIVIQLIFTIGLGWILSVLNVFLRDLGQAISVILMFLMFMSPIIWLPEMLGNGLIRIVLYINPLYYLINLYRLPLFYGKCPSPIEIIVILIMSLVIFFVGYRFFIRIKPYLVDYV